MDYLVNDINNPYKNSDIIEISNVRVMVGDLDYSHLLQYDFSNYESNKTKVGTFEVVFFVEIDEIIYKYTLKIINKDFNENNQKTTRLNNINIETTKTNYLSNNELFLMVEENLKYKIENPTIIDSNYFNNEEEGVFYSLVKFKNKGNDFEVLIEIDVIPKDFKNIKIIIGSSIIAITLVVFSFKKYRKRRSYENKNI